MKVINKNKIEISVEEIDALEASLPKDWMSADREREERLTEKLIKLTGDNLRWRVNNKIVLRYKNSPPLVRPGVIYREVFREEGFTPEEYSKLTRKPCPNHWGDRFVGEYNGKVCIFDKAGNISIQRGHPSNYNPTKIKYVETRANIEIIVTGL